MHIQNTSAPKTQRTLWKRGGRTVGARGSGSFLGDCIFQEYQKQNLVKGKKSTQLTKLNLWCWDHCDFHGSATVLPRLLGSLSVWSLLLPSPATRLSYLFCAWQMLLKQFPLLFLVLWKKVRTRTEESLKTGHPGLREPAGLWSGSSSSTFEDSRQVKNFYYAFSNTVVYSELILHLSTRAIHVAILCVGR